jgi:hypothetical protein
MQLFLFEEVKTTIAIEMHGNITFLSIDQQRRGRAQVQSSSSTLNDRIVFFLIFSFFSMDDDHDGCCCYSCSWLVYFRYFRRYETIPLKTGREKSLFLVEELISSVAATASVCCYCFFDDVIDDLPYFHFLDLR